MKTQNKANAEKRGGEFTTAPVTAPTASSADDFNWRRLPRPKTRLAGLSRTTWNELLDDGKVKGITLRKKHAQRGIKLIYWPSAEAYLKSLLDSKEAQS